MFKCKHKDIVKKYTRKLSHGVPVLVYYEYCNKCKALLRGGVSLAKDNIVTQTKCVKIANDSNINDGKTLGHIIKKTYKKKVKETEKEEKISEELEEKEILEETPKKQSYFKRRDARKEELDESMVFVKGTQDRKRKKRV